MWIDNQSIEDIELDKVKILLAAHCKSELAKHKALNIKPFKDRSELLKEFNLLNELQLIHLDSSIVFPHSNTEDIDYALKLLAIENGILTLDELVKVFNLCLSTKELVDFSVLHQERFPLVFAACAHIHSLKDILKIIHAVLAPSGQIKNDATKNLAKIRSTIAQYQKESNHNFEKLVSRYKSDNLLADTEETYLENRRLLAVLSVNRKKVKGRVYGASAKGNFTYIEPEENVQINKQLDRYRIEEHNEILEILRKTTEALRADKKHLEAFERLLIRFDLNTAKILFAATYQGCIPKINSDTKMYWQNAKHPLLLLKNKALNQDTIGQDIELTPSKRFLVISGPNAGGKSVTLKTIGLLQLMFQSALLVAVDDVSNFTLFDQLLTDIGDNQSIDNQLSTYSYRLSRMQLFLEKSNHKTLVLLDEFGSGSDPELGGALAEVFFEDLYAKKCFAVINTHYTNIKILSSTLMESVNACMLFDSLALKPLYKLSVGQPGSSFTFEVAKLNGIADTLIERAKGKVTQQKINLDALALSLQNEKSNFKKLNSEQVKLSTQAKKSLNVNEILLENLQHKAIQQQRYIEQHNKYVQAGKKLFELIQKYKSHKTNKALNEAVLKFVAIEKTKVKAQKNHVVFQSNIKAPDLPKVAQLITQQQSSKNEITQFPSNLIQEKSDKIEFKINDKVKIPQNPKSGIIKEIKGNRVVVQIENFTFQTTINELIKI